jgi:hypothetical protein
MHDIFRINGTLKHDPEIDAWLNQTTDELRAMARKWFSKMRQCGDDVRELIHDGCPVACIEDAPFAYVNAFKEHVNIGFFYGAVLDDPARILEGSGKRMRHVKIKPSQEVDAAALNDLINAAYADIKWRLNNERTL